MLLSPNAICFNVKGSFAERKRNTKKERTKTKEKKRKYTTAIGFWNSIQRYHVTQARSWHADDVVRTPHVASRPFFFFFLAGPKLSVWER